MDGAKDKMQTQNKIQRYLELRDMINEQAKETGLSSSEIELILHWGLYCSEKQMKINEVKGIYRKGKISQPTISLMINSLSNKGYVQKFADKLYLNDQRERLVQLTPNGKALYRNLEKML
jgi:DNA-binding MarR family transcriptional regulator